MKGLPRNFPGGGGGNWIKRAKTYFASVLEFPLHPDLEHWDRLTVLYAVRNAYAHANGRPGLMTKHVRDTLKPVIDPRTGITPGTGITYEWNGLHVDGPYARGSYEFVESLLKDLIHRALEWADREGRRPGKGAG